MGIVFKGFDRELNRPIAIKVLSPQFSSIGAARARFSREARAAAAICHENVVSIYRIDSSGKSPFIVMPYISGGSLDEFIKEHGPLDAVRIVQISKQISAALEAAHDVGVIHRDVKPANVLLENGCNRVVLTDFGLAQVENDLSLTRSGFIAGTPYFMSPEQAQGKTVDNRSDLFALGAVMYFMATGQPPFVASNAMTVLNKICQEKLVDVRVHNPNIPSVLANIIHSLLEKNPEHRFKSAGQVEQVLTQYLATLAIPNRPSQTTCSPPLLHANSRSLENSGRRLSRHCFGERRMDGLESRCRTKFVVDLFQLNVRAHQPPRKPGARNTATIVNARNHLYEGIGNGIRPERVGS